MKQPESVTLSPEEGEAILARLSIYAPSRSDCEILMPVMRWYFWLMFALQKTKITVQRLRGLLVGKSLKASPAPEEASKSSQTGRDETSAWGELEADVMGSAAPPAPSQNPQRAKLKGGHRAGTGRLGADAYAGAERIQCRHEALAAGQRCPVCGQGSLYELPPGVEIRIDGHALLSAMRDEQEKRRCSACGPIFTASLPPEAGAATYSPRARAVRVVGRYYLGLPFYRIEGYQARLGTPRPDSTQWDQIENVGDGCDVVFEYLERVAAQGELIYQDDTTVRIWSLFKKNQQIRADAFAQGWSRAQARTGMFTTARVVRVGEPLLCLYDSGRAHAGENLAALLAQREADLEPPLVMSDALSRHDIDEGLVMRCHCLTHGRRQFSDIEEVFPTECRVGLEALKQGVDHEEEAREQQMSPEARLAYHQAYSQPLMDDLKSWLGKQMADRLVEPNSAVGQAIADMQAHWVTLTRCLQIEGAPLDHHLVERALKLFIRQRKNSLFYKSEHRAYMASVLTRLSVTCIYAGVNVIDYFVALQEPRAEVCADPSAWLPWTDATSRASPSATRRQSWAIWARSGAPFQIRIINSRADMGTCASGVLGHQWKRP
jgi:transposase